MNKNVYEKTRYQNIYRHKKNKNYVVMISKPVKTSISQIDGKKIWKIEDAVKVRDDPKIKLQKEAEIKYKDNFDELWNKYIDMCKYELKQEYNTYHKKEKMYNKYLKGKFDKPINKLSKEFFVKFIDDLDTTDKQKNVLLKMLRTFFNWLVNEEVIIFSPLSSIKKYKVTKNEMKFWVPEDFTKFIAYLNNEIEAQRDLKLKELAYRIKIFTLLGFCLGNRVGETRALTFGSIDKNKNTIVINHSINYNPNEKDFLSTTKTYTSQREINIPEKLIEEVDKYRYFLENNLCYRINDNSLIFFNYSTNKPLSDVSLRKSFYNFIEKAGVPKIRMYDLRHTYVATMMANGVELYLISSNVGHIDYSTTVNEYGHLSSQIRKEMANITNKYL